MIKKVLYLAAADGLTLEQSGGAGTHMRGVINAFRENGFDVLPIIAGDENIHVSGLRSSIQKSTLGKRNVRQRLKDILPNKFRLALRDLRTIWNDYRLEKAILNKVLSYKADLIYERAAYLSTLGLRLAKRLKVPHFIETDGCMVEIIGQDYGVFSKRIGNWVERKKLRIADHAVVMNKLAIKQVARKFGLNESKFVVKTLGVDESDFVENVSNQEVLIERFQLRNKFVVGFVGAISSYHGVNYLIDAAQEIFKRGNKDVRIVIVGWSKEGESLLKTVNERGLDNVVFTGKIDKSEIADYYRLFDVGIIPDSEESIYPIKVLEYGLMGLCPMVPGYEVFEELIIPYHTGFLFSPKNPLSLSETILNISNQKTGVKACAENWHRFVLDNFKWKDSLNELIKLIRCYDNPSS